MKIVTKDNVMDTLVILLGAVTVWAIASGPMGWWQWVMFVLCILCTSWLLACVLTRLRDALIARAFRDEEETDA